MSIGSTVKTVGQFIGGILIMLAFIALPIAFLFGMTAVSLWMLQWNGVIFEWTLAGALVFAVMSIIPPLRTTSAIGLTVASMAFSMVIWLTGVAYTYVTWGFVALVIGLVIVGVGVVPVAMLAAIIHGQWDVLISFVIMLVLSFGCRAFGTWLAMKEDERTARKYYADVEVFE